MSDLYKYTFAELEFLLADQPGWSQGRELLGLKSEAGEGARMAGAASLLMRGLAQVNGDDIVVDPAVVAPVAVLVSGGTAFILSLSRNEQFALSTLIISRDPAGRVLVSPDQPGVFEIRPMTLDIDAITLLTSLSLGVVGEDGTIAIAQGDTVVQVQHLDGEWSWRTGDDQPMLPAPESEIREQMTRIFGPVLEA